MDKLKSRILFILLIGIILCSVQAIAAADVSDAGVNDDVFDLSNDIETVQADSIDEILDAPSSDEVVRAEEDEPAEELPNGTFTGLQTIINSNQNGTIELDRNYTYTTPSDNSLISGIQINKNIVIDGKGHTIDGKSVARLFSITGAYTVTLKNLNLINGQAQRNQDGNYYGGAIYTPNSNVNLTIDNCTFENNVANMGSQSGRGGAIYFNRDNRRAALTIKNSSFVNNSAYYGGAIYGSTFNITDSNFTQNKAVNGSAIYARSSYTKSISNTKILKNRANSTALTIYRLNEHGTQFDGFYGTFTGHDNLINGIYLSSGSITMVNVTYYNGTEAVTPATSTSYSNSWYNPLDQTEAGIPINIVITNETGDVVKNVTVYTDSSGRYEVTEEQLQLDYGTFSAYAIHYEDAYYTQIRKDDPRGDFYSYMYLTEITNATVEGYAGETRTVTFTVTRTRDGSAVDEGKVIVNINGHNYTANVNSQGRATVTITLPEEGGDFNVTYDGTGTSNWNATGTLKVIIKEKSDTEVTVTPQNIQVGTDETITFSVSPSDITGTTVKVVIVDSQGNEKFNSTVAISAGTVTVPNLPAGTYTVTVSYAGDIGHNPSEDSADFIVSKNASSVSVVPEDIFVGMTETVQVTVGPEGASGTVNVTILDADGNYVDSKNVTLSSGSASAEFTGLAYGEYNATVYYSGDAYYNASSNSAKFIVSKNASSVSVVPEDIFVGMTETVQVTVGPEGASGTVNVTILDADGNYVDSKNVTLSSGSASAEFTGLAYGEYNATVYYSGDAYYNASSNSAKFIVSKNASSVSVVPEDIFVGMTETVQVTVGPEGASGTVNVTILDADGNYVDSKNVTLSSGSASAEFTGLAYGEYNATVYYSGDAYYNASSNSAKFIVSKNASSVSVVPEDIFVGMTETVQVTVGPEGASGTVNVTILDADGNYVDSKNVTLSSGSASAEFTGLAYGEYNATVYYSGDAYYNASSNSAKFIVSKNASSVSVVPEDIFVGMTETVQVTVGPEGASGTVNVTILDADGNYVDSKNVTLSSGSASAEFTGLAYGEYNATVYYSGDAYYNASSNSAKFIVSKNASSVSVVPEDIFVGMTETVQVTVGPEGASGTVNVTILDADGNYVDSKNVTLSSGSASAEFTGLAYGEYNATVYYSGDAYYNASSNSAKFIVSKNASSVSVVPEDIFVGMTETVQVTVGPEGASGTVNVTILDADGNYVDSKNVTLSSGSASAEFTGLAYGEYNATVYYSGDAYYNASSNSAKFIVSKNASSVSVVPEDIFVGMTETVQVTVGPEGASGTVNVTILDADGNYVDSKNVTLSSGSASAEFTGLAYGEYNATVYYSGDAYYNASSNSAKFIVSKNASSVSVVPEDIFVGMTETVQVTVGPEGASGTVNVTILDADGNYVDSKNVTLSSGSASAEFTGLAYGEYNATVYYSGDAYYNASSNSAKFIVSKNASSVSVVPEDIFVGMTETVQVTVGPEGASGTVNVTILDADGNYVDSKNVTLSSGSASAEFTGLAYGEYNATVYYSGDAYYNASSNSAKFLVSKNASSVSVVPEDIFVGMTETVQVTVGPEGASGTVNVTILDADGNYVDSKNVTLSSGSASAEFTGLAYGEYNATVYYSGDAYYNASSNSAKFIVSKNASSVSVVPEDIFVGMTETVQVTVGPEGASGTVNVTILDADGNYVDSKNVTLSSGSASAEFTGLAYGEYNATVYYSGDAYYNASSNSAKFIVSKNASSVSVVPEDIFVGMTETVQVTVGPEGASGTVNVTILDADGNYVDSKNVTLSSGSASAEFTGLAYGEYNATVYYSGDAYYNASSNSAKFIVSKNASSVSVVPEDIFVGMTETVQVTVGPEGASGTVNVTILDADGNYVDSKNVTLSSGSASAEFTGLAYGEYNATVYYSGDAYYNASSNSAKFIVSKNASSVSVVPEDIFVGMTETVQVTVGPEGASGTVNVTILDADGNYVDSKNVTLSSGSASAEFTGLAYGEYNATVYYSGDAYYNASSNSAKFIVSKVNSTIELSLNNIVYGETETITATITDNNTGAPIAGTVNITVTGDNGYSQTFKNVQLENGVATKEIAGLGAGTYTVTVDYGGDDKYNSNSKTDTFTVGKADPVLTVTPSGNITVDEDETISISLNDDAQGTVDVTVTSDKGYTQTFTGISVNNGQVEPIKLEDLPAGNYTVSVDYSGDSNYNSADGTGTFSVKKHTVTIIVVNQVIGYFGETVQVIINLTDENGNAVESGTVEYIIDFENKTGSYILGEVNGFILAEGTDVSDGQAIQDVDLSAAPGTYGATVTYTGNDRYEDAATTDEATILPLNTTTESDDVSGNVGDKVTITADILDQNNNAVQNGTATLIIDGKEYNATVDKGKATWTIELPSENTTATIKYLGNDYYNPSTTTIDITVNEEPSPGPEPGPEPQPGPEPEPSPSKTVTAKVLATGNPIAMLVMVLITLVSTISIRRQK